MPANGKERIYVTLLKMATLNYPGCRWGNTCTHIYFIYFFNAEKTKCIAYFFKLPVHVNTTVSFLTMRIIKQAIYFNNCN